MSVTPTVQDRPELRKVIQEMIDSGFTGVHLRVNDHRGEWVAAGVAERGDSAPPPVDGYLRVGSVTKPFTATAVLRLVAEGRTGLDDAVAGHLPELGLDPRITVRMLLQHTSGVFNFTGEYLDDGTVVPGIPGRAASGWRTGSRPTCRRNWYGWRCPSRRGSSRGRTGATPTPTTYWPGC